MLGKYRQAEEAFTKSIAINPDLHRVYYNMGICLLRQKKFSRAEEYMLKALEEDVDFLEARYVLGVIKGKLGKFKEAEKIFHKPIKAYSSFIIDIDADKNRDERLAFSGIEQIKKAHQEEWNSFLSGIRLSKKHEEYEKKLKEAAKGDNSLKTWHDFGTELYRRKKFAEAEKIFDKIISTEKKYLKLAESFGMQKLAQNDYQQAAESYSVLGGLLTAYKEAGIILGASLGKQKKYDKAEQIFKDAVNIDKSDQRTLDGLAVVLTQSDKLKEASEIYEEIICLAENDADIRYRYSGILFRQKDYAQAVEHLGIAVGQKQDFLKAWLRLGDCYCKLNRYDQAEEAYNKVLSINASHQTALQKLAASLYRQEKYQQALEAMNNIADFSQDFELLDMKGEANLKLGNFREAEEVYEQLIGTRDDKTYYEKLAEALLSQKKYLETEKIYHKLLEIDKDNETAAYNLGCLYGELERYNEAQDFLTKATRINGSKKETWYHLGIVLGDMKKYQEAVESFDKVLEIDSRCEEALNNKGVCAFKQGDYLNAESYFKEAANINPQYREAWHNLEICLRRQRKIQEADKAFEKYNQITI